MSVYRQELKLALQSPEPLLNRNAIHPSFISLMAWLNITVRVLFFFKEKLCRSLKLSKFLLLYTFKLKSI